MMMFNAKSLKLTAVAGSFLLGNGLAMAGPRFAAEDPVVVRAAVGRAVEIEIEAGVADLVRSGDPASIKAEHTSGHLFVTPLSTDPAGLTVIDTRGHSHHISFIFGDGVDDRIVVPDGPGPAAAAAPRDAGMALMRDLVLGHVPAVATELRSDTLMFDNGRVRVHCVLVEELPRLRGFVAAVENLTRAPLVVPVQQVIFPGLLAVASQKDILGPGESCRLYLVAER